ncbi:hypothetical protein ACHAWF_012518 [Thalassiosira exigua]
MNSAFNSNHTCEIYDFDDLRGINENKTNTFHSGPDSKGLRRRKCYALLCRRHGLSSNCSHLDRELGEECSVKLVPMVLESVSLSLRYGYEESPDVIAQQEHESSGLRMARILERAVPPLSVMFEIIRGWKMPDLYERR